MPVKQTRYITALEAAEIMGMNARYVRRLCATDKLACERFGKVYMVLRTAAEAYVRDPYGRGRPSATQKASTNGKEDLLEGVRKGRHEKRQGRENGA